MHHVYNDLYPKKEVSGDLTTLFISKWYCTLWFCICHNYYIILGIATELKVPWQLLGFSQNQRKGTQLSMKRCLSHQLKGAKITTCLKKKYYSMLLYRVKLAASKSSCTLSPSPSPAPYASPLPSPPPPGTAININMPTSSDNKSRQVLKWVVV